MIHIFSYFPHPRLFVMDKITLQNCIKKKLHSRIPTKKRYQDNHGIFLKKTFKQTSKTSSKRDIKTTTIYFVFQNYIKRVRQSCVKPSFIKIASKKWIGNDADFQPIEMIPKKARRNDVEFSSVETTSKKYVEMT